MSVGVPTCSLQTPLRQVALQLVNSDIDCVVVLDPEGHAPGVVSQDDLVKAYAETGWEDLLAEDVMQEHVPQISPGYPHHRGGADYARPACAFGLYDAPCRRHHLFGGGAHL